MQDNDSVSINQMYITSSQLFNHSHLCITDKHSKGFLFCCARKLSVWNKRSFRQLANVQRRLNIAHEYILLLSMAKVTRYVFGFA